MLLIKERLALVIGRFDKEFIQIQGIAGGGCYQNFYSWFEPAPTSTVSWP
jgi:hypothetical protein